MQILNNFTYAHLPVHLQEVSKPFCDLAQQIADLTDSEQEKAEILAEIQSLVVFVKSLPYCDDQEVALFNLEKMADFVKKNFPCIPTNYYLLGYKKDALILLMQAKDCSVRAKLTKEVQERKETRYDKAFDLSLTLDQYIDLNLSGLPNVDHLKSIWEKLPLSDKNTITDITDYAFRQKYPV